MPIIKNNDIEQYYEIHGNGEPLLLIAGLSCDCLLWTDLLPELSKKYKVIIFDNRGAGRSSAPEGNYTAEQMAEDTFALLKALHIKKAYILGHSMGGTIAQYLAYKHPDIVHKLVLCCTAIEFNPIAYASQKAMLELRSIKAPVPVQVDTILPWLYSDRFFQNDAMLQTVRDLMIHQPYPQTNQGFAGQYHAILDFDSSKWIGKITAPTLVMGGGKDLLCAGNAASLSKAIKQSICIEFPQSGHLPFIEEPMEFLRYLEAFLSQPTSILAK